MKKTLLEITQIILGKLDSDEVNSIGDTTESLQVSQEIETTFYELFANLQWPSRQKLLSFEAVSDPTNRPNYLKVKEAVDNFEFIMYNIGTSTAPEYQKLTYLTPKEFLLYASQNATSSSAMQVVEDWEGALYPIKTDKHPTYYTMFDDEYIACDSFLSTADDSLQESKAFGLAQVIPVFEQTDDYVPEMPAKYFPLLIAEAASMCFINTKGAPNSKEEQRSHRQLVRQQNNRSRSGDAQRKTGPDYGR